MLREIRGLGFEYAELSHGIRISLLPGIIEAVDAGEIKISTLHNFCPLPMGITHAAPNIFKFTSVDPRERANALRYSLKTIETAARLKARLVVLHMGAIDMKDYTDRLIEMVESGQKDTPKYEKLCEEANAKREAKKERHVELANDMLKQLIEAAEPAGIQLGIENREALEEIPLESDFHFFFKDFPGPTVGYRITSPEGRVLTYLPDHEPALGVLQFPALPRAWTSGGTLAVDADLLIHDSQYSAAEYACHCGWGHSSIDQTLDFGTLTAVKQLVTFHHDPEHTDQDLDRLLTLAVEKAKPDYPVTPGIEGTVFEL